MANTRTFILALVATLGVGSLCSAAERPNVVLILGDDQAWTDYGFMGHPDVETPNLDKLAARSLVFDRGYVASPLCRPSLASMITGLFPFQHGVTGNDVDGRNNRAALDTPLREQFHARPSFIRTLTTNGYLAHQSGKWWEGSFQDGGFTHGMTHGDPMRGGRHGDAGLKIGRKGMQPVTDFIDHAVAKKKPFFVWYAPFLPHTPHNPPARLLDKYTEDGRAPDAAKYYAMCEWFDETCGQLLNHLDDAGVTDNTLVLFICDNGWAATSTNANDPNQKLWRGFALRSKGSPYENGIRTPILVSWPNRLKPRRCEDLAHAIDLFPTIAAATGLDAPTELPGINLADSEARGNRHRVFGVTHSIHNMTVGNPDDTQQYLWCVGREWKLIQRFHGKDTTRYKNVHMWDTAPVRLFNIKSDPHERNDAAKEYPGVVERLKLGIADWRRTLARE
ncbi:MAG: sulfatase-like hydrolase/transferase [Pirellulaceae bacterium]|jgi:arylsulfatase A-like enzyme|nr:sulfatase-like hydrolase/transferase [Pirellulaceae bacterium]